MRRRCEALARKYRDSDEGRPDSDELTDDAETARKVSNEPQTSPRRSQRRIEWRTDLYGDSGPSY